MMFSILFYLFFVLLVSSHRYLDVSQFEKIKDYEEKTLSSSKWEAYQVTLDHIDPMCFPSLVYTGMHALILLPKPHTLGFGFILG
jgi:hypothetical protein